MGPAMKTGFIGLGAMGQHMARNLHRAGLLAGTWNRTAAKSAAFARESGSTAFESPAALAAACDAVFTCVSADEDLLAVVDGLLPTLRPGALVIDCSTVAADTARAAHARVAAAGASFLDCPVSGGVEGAKNATLAIMCGGDEDAFRCAQPLLQAIGKTIAERLIGQGVKRVVFDRNGFLYHGRVKAVADAAREAGLEF